MARQVWAEVQRGKDPRETLVWLKNRAAARRSAEAPEGGFTDLCRAYLADSSQRLRTSTHQLYRRLLDGQVIPAFGAREPATITRAEVKTWGERLRRTPTQANRSMAVMRLVCDWAVREGLLSASPCVGLKKPAPEVPRSRYLSHDEIRAVEALKQERPLIAAYYELLFLTGVRRSKPLEAEWKDVDTKTAVWHIPITKRARGTPGGHREAVHDAPDAPGAGLPAHPGGLLGHSRFVFPGGSPRRSQLDEAHRLHNPQKSIDRLRERSGVDFQIRDIRRTVATRMAEDLGISPFIIAKVMDHKLPGEAEMGEVYNRYDYMPEKRRALMRWCDHLDNVRADRRTRKVVSMTPKGVE